MSSLKSWLDVCRMRRAVTDDRVAADRGRSSHADEVLKGVSTVF